MILEELSEAEAADFPFFLRSAVPPPALFSLSCCNLELTAAVLDLDFLPDRDFTGPRSPSDGRRTKQ